jgi:hypothetical protein
VQDQSLADAVRAQRCRPVGEVPDEAVVEVAHGLLALDGQGGPDVPAAMPRQHQAAAET